MITASVIRDVYASATAGATPLFAVVDFTATKKLVGVGAGQTVGFGDPGADPTRWRYCLSQVKSASLNWERPAVIDLYDAALVPSYTGGGVGGPVISTGIDEAELVKAAIACGINIGNNSANGLVSDIVLPLNWSGKLLVRWRRHSNRSHSASGTVAELRGWRATMVLNRMDGGLTEYPAHRCGFGAELAEDEGLLG